MLETTLVISLVVHLGFLLTEGFCSPKGREKEYARAHDLVTHGPYATQHWRAGVLLGVVLPLLLLCIPGMGAFAVPVAAVMALIGLYAEEDVLVRAGQALSIS